MRGSEMRRRAPEYRRQSRRRLPGWIWWLVGIFLVVGLMLFVLHHNQKEQFRPPVINKGSETEEVSPGKVNFTEELLSSTSFARQLADQMTLAKAYVILAKEHGNLQLAWELSSQIRNSQRLLSQGAVSGRAITQEEAHPIITRLARLIYKAQDSHYDISTTMVTLKSHALALEERAKAAVVQTAEFGQLAAESLPKNIHCLTVKLTEEWLQNPKLRSRSEEHRNSTRWLSEMETKGSSGGLKAQEQEIKFHNPKFVSLLNHLRFYIPQILPNLEKVVFLDDDVVVQKDLTQLFSIELHGNVIGAVETCLESFHRYHKYLNFSQPIISSKIDPHTCGWAFGMNIFDLIAWRKANATSL
uniref:Hexosyltransferase n=1 Tax=Triticum urartu TaxID=4572 RepID=A0A8R7Q462_TRIUA